MGSLEPLEPLKGIHYHFDDKDILYRLWRFTCAVIRKKKIDKSTYKLTPWERFMFNFEGFKGQYAVNELTGSKFDWTVRVGGDGGIDGRYKGLTYQVKANTKYIHPDAYLTIWDEQPLIADIAILTLKGELYGYPYGSIEIYGWITRENFYKNCRNFPGRKVVVCINLEPIRTFIDDSPILSSNL